MEDKVFNLMEKMYIEMQDMKKELKSEMKEMQSEFKGVQSEIKGIKEVMATKQDIVRLESKMDENHRALYDGYKQSIEGIHGINIRLDKLTDRVDNQEASIRLLKSIK
ncbi:hypothetical protein [Alkaliphilus serpentinus]|uniref:Uncharacterized protein n=1 Tax=Alkaliphilus serpentinus TaxID=1482731 RepID=A0A833MAZ9_9FIRM|nr:hypothetical protein [Alkaliphilus serpentinus]KAB3531868.1 hypothetical protein F8153_03885 [Alkaliphilus serpentinus]